MYAYRGQVGAGEVGEAVGGLRGGQGTNVLLDVLDHPQQLLGEQGAHVAMQPRLLALL